MQHTLVHVYAAVLQTLSYVGHAIGCGTDHVSSCCASMQRVIESQISISDAGASRLLTQEVKVAAASLPMHTMDV